jgi:hypothetical protein
MSTQFNGWGSTVFNGGISDMKALLAYNLQTQWTAAETLEYTRRCYQNTTLNDNRACGSYAVPFIPSVRSEKVECPFSDKICTTPWGFEVDTGVVDAAIHLGINLAPQSRVGFRKILTCAPILAEERYSSDWTSEVPSREWFAALQKDPIPGDMYRYYYLGGQQGISPNQTFWTSKLEQELGRGGYDVE